jgi:transposase, IS6 family
MMIERGLHIDHTTIYRWVQHYAPELEKRCRLHLKATNDSWRVDETYVKVKKAWMYLYRAVDSQGNTLEFLLSPRRHAEAAKRFFKKALTAPHISTPRVITVDKNAAYPKAFKELKAERSMPDSCELRQSKYLNNLIEQVHRFILPVGQARDGFLFIRDGVANCTGIGSYEYAQERSDSWCRKRRQYEAGDIHRQPIWSGCVS